MKTAILSFGLLFLFLCINLVSSSSSSSSNSKRQEELSIEEVGKEMLNLLFGEIKIKRKEQIELIESLQDVIKVIETKYNSSRFDVKFEKYNSRLMKLVQSLKCEVVDQVTLFNIFNLFIDNVKECARLRNQPNSRGLKRIENILLENFIDQESIKKMIENLENNNSKHVETEAVNRIESLNINSAVKKSRSNDEFIDKLSEYPEGTLAFKYSTLWNNLTELNNLELSKSELKQSMIQLIEDFSQDFGGACQDDVLLVAFDQVIYEIRQRIIEK